MSPLSFSLSLSFSHNLLLHHKKPNQSTPSPFPSSSSIFATDQTEQTSDPYRLTSIRDGKEAKVHRHKPRRGGSNHVRAFCTTANSLSQLYTHAMNHQKLSFHAGERHALEKLYQWIWRQEGGASRVATVDVLNYIQNELDYCGEEPSMSPRAPLQHPQSQPVMHVASSVFPVTSGSSGQTIAGQGLRSENYENQPRNTVFSSALSSPIRRSLQHYQIGEGGYSTSGLSVGNGNRNTDPNDSAMDMHAD